MHTMSSNISIVILVLMMVRLVVEFVRLITIQIYAGHNSW